MKNSSSLVNYKIWLDLRFLNINDNYSIFIASLLQELINNDKNNKYKLYLNDKAKMKFNSSIDVSYIWAQPGTMKEQIEFFRILKKDNNNLMIFFNEKKPLFYKWKYILFLKDLKELHYKEEKSKVKGFIDDFFFDTSLKNASKVVCFDNQTKSELNEKLNIEEESISIIYPFFQKKDTDIIEVISSVKTKYSINSEFLIYSWWFWNNKNLSKLINVFEKLNNKKINVSLVILDQDVTEDINFRKEVVDAWIVNKVFFIWNTTLEEKKAFYDESIWSIFPSLYESFPFKLTESINYNSPILASSIKQIKEIMWDEISYFSPVSTIDMMDAIETFVLNWKQETNYKNLFEKYNSKNTAKSLLELIEKV